MGVWKSLSERAGKVRDLLRPGTGGGLVEVEGIRSASALIRAIDSAMPRGAILWIDYPGDEAVELYLAERTGRTLDRAEKAFRLPIRGDNLPMLARLVEGAPLRTLGIHIGVDHERRRLLAAYDLDSNTAEVGVSPKLGAESQRVFRLIATEAAAPVRS